MSVFNYAGSAMLIVLIAFILDDVIESKKITIKGLLGRLIFIVIFFIALLRT